MSADNYIRPSEENHKAIAAYLEAEFFCYLDSLGTNEFDNDNEKEFIKRFIKVISKSFGKSQEYISTALDKGDHTIVSYGTKRANRFLESFCSKTIIPPIQIFFYHINSKDEKKRIQCHLACSYGKPISTIKGSKRRYSHNISSLEHAKISNKPDITVASLDTKPSSYSNRKDVENTINIALSLLKSHQIIEAKRLLCKLNPLDPKVIFYKQLADLVYKPIRKFGNNEAKRICKNLETLLQTKMGLLSAVLLHDIYEKYHCRLGRKFDIDLPNKPPTSKIKDLPEYELINLIVNHK